MRLILALVLIAGCAEAGHPDVVYGDGPVPGEGGGGRGGTVGTDAGAGPEVGGQGGAPVRVCDAALETLSGRATYVAHSARAADPDLVFNGTTCGDYVDGTDWEGDFTPLAVTAGMAGSNPMVMVGGAPAGAGCTYTLGLTTLVPGGTPCMVTRDYILTVP